MKFLMYFNEQLKNNYTVTFDLVRLRAIALIVSLEINAVTIF